MLVRALIFTQGKVAAGGTDFDWHMDWQPKPSDPTLIGDGDATRSVLTYVIKLDAVASCVEFAHDTVQYLAPAGSALCFHAKAYHKVCVGNKVRKLTLHFGDQAPHNCMDPRHYFPVQPTSRDYSDYAGDFHREALQQLGLEDDIRRSSLDGRLHTRRVCARGSDDQGGKGKRRKQAVDRSPASSSHEAGAADEEVIHKDDDVAELGSDPGCEGHGVADQGANLEPEVRVAVEPEARVAVEPEAHVAVDRALLSSDDSDDPDVVIVPKKRTVSSSNIKEVKEDLNTAFKFIKGLRDQYPNFVLGTVVRGASSAGGASSADGEPSPPITLHLPMNATKHPYSKGPLVSTLGSSSSLSIAANTTRKVSYVASWRVRTFGGASTPASDELQYDNTSVGEALHCNDSDDGDEDLCAPSLDTADAEQEVLRSIQEVHASMAMAAQADLAMQGEALQPMQAGASSASSMPASSKPLASSMPALQPMQAGASSSSSIPASSMQAGASSSSSIPASSMPLASSLPFASMPSSMPEGLRAEGKGVVLVGNLNVVSTHGLNAPKATLAPVPEVGEGAAHWWPSPTKGTKEAAASYQRTREAASHVQLANEPMGAVPMTRHALLNNFTHGEMMVRSFGFSSGARMIHPTKTKEATCRTWVCSDAMRQWQAFDAKTRPRLEQWLACAVACSNKATVPEDMKSMAEDIGKWPQPVCCGLVQLKCIPANQGGIVKLYKGTDLDRGSFASAFKKFKSSPRPTHSQVEPPPDLRTYDVGDGESESDITYVDLIVEHSLDAHASGAHASGAAGCLLTINTPAPLLILPTALGPLPPLSSTPWRPAGRMLSCLQWDTVLNSPRS